MLVAASIVFFVSGFAGLVYQVVWQRLLIIFSGSDLHSATIIVAAFMTGLGCGSLAGGRLADRLSRTASVAAFGLAELAVGVFGATSAFLYYDILYRKLGAAALSTTGTAAIVFASLLWPTFFMGMSLPLLARALTRTVAGAGTIIGSLYGWNTLGAAMGALATTWWLVPHGGLDGSLHASAWLNFAAAAGSVPLALAVRRAGGGNEAADAAAPAASLPVAAPRLARWMALYAASGFVALSLEIVWFRVVGVLLKSTTFAFGTMIAIYLAGLGLGSAAGARLVRRSRNAGREFLALQAASGLSAGLALTLLVAALDDQRTPEWLVSYFSGPPWDVSAAVSHLGSFLLGRAAAPRHFLLLYVAIPAMLIGPPTVLLGASFPFLQRAVQTDPARIGSRVGLLLLANIAGSALGPIVTGWFCLEWFGAAGTARLLIAVAAVFPVVGLMLFGDALGRAARVQAAAALAAGALVVTFAPDARALWLSLHGARSGTILFREDGTGTFLLTVASGGRSARTTVYVNGAHHSWIPYGGVHTVLGALPAFMHPDPRRAVVIGLGSGDTLFSVAARPGIERVTCVEIVRPQLATLSVLQELRPYPGLEVILRDPRIEHVYGDGRLHLLRDARRYDIIEADALHPGSAYAGNLYSDEYFALVRDRLTPAGLAVSWTPTERVRNTFLNVFPHVLIYGDLAVGSRSPIPFDPAAIRARLAAPDVRSYFRQAGVDIVALMAPYLDPPPRVFAPHDRPPSSDDINTDLRPKDEFGVR